jgi:hypothetical protein
MLLLLLKRFARMYTTSLQFTQSSTHYTTNVAIDYKVAVPYSKNVRARAMLFSKRNSVKRTVLQYLMS